jgi:hypothetical protein
MALGLINRLFPFPFLVTAHQEGLRIGQSWSLRIIVEVWFLPMESGSKKPGLEESQPEEKGGRAEQPSPTWVQTDGTKTNPTLVTLAPGPVEL